MSLDTLITIVCLAGVVIGYGLMRYFEKNVYLKVKK